MASEAPSARPASQGVAEPRRTRPVARRHSWHLVKLSCANGAPAWRRSRPRLPRPWLALRTELEGLLEGLRLAAELPGNGAVFGVGGDERLGLTRLGALVHVEHGVVD